MDSQFKSIDEIPDDLRARAVDASNAILTAAGSGLKFYDLNGSREKIICAAAHALLVEREASVSRATDWFDGFISGPAKEADFDDLERAIRGL